MPAKKSLSISNFEEIQMNAIFDSLKTIFHDTFENDGIEISPTLTANDVDEWDSLSHIRLMVAIEEKFKFRFTAAEIASFKNVGDLANCIERKITK